MRFLKLASALLGITFALAALGPALASAANPAFLGEKVIGLTFKGESGKTTLHAVGAEPDLVCLKDKNSGELTGEKTLKIAFDLEECKEGGFAALSLGDASGVVLFSISGELCYINEAAKEVGVYSKIPAEGIHVEVPAIKFLELFTGTFIGKALFVNVSQALQDISYKKPNIKECGKKVASLEDTINGKVFAGEIESVEELHFAQAIEIMA